MSEKEFVMAWLLVTRANGKVSWADSLHTAKIIAKQAREIYKQLEELDETNG